MLLGDGNMLTLEKVGRQHSGSYICEAENGVREPAVAEIILKVLSNYDILKNQYSSLSKTTNFFHDVHNNFLES